MEEKKRCYHVNNGNLRETLVFYQSMYLGEFLVVYVF